MGSDRFPSTSNFDQNALQAQEALEYGGRFGKMTRNAESFAHQFVDRHMFFMIE